MYKPVLLRDMTYVFPTGFHPCQRQCRANDVRECNYIFTIEEFATMSSLHCGDCPNTPGDCDLPGCVPAGGVRKPIVVINRQVPGPAIQVSCLIKYLRLKYCINNFHLNSSDS
jgi:hypothetical protein